MKSKEEASECLISKTMGTSKSLSYKGQKVMFDITLWYYKDTNDPTKGVNYATWKDLYRKLKEWCKKFTFQLEKGHLSGKLHWQIRVCLIRRCGCIDLLSRIVPEIGGTWNLTSSSTHEGGPNSFNYVMKADTRVEGPYSEKNLVADAPRMTRALANYRRRKSQGDVPTWHPYLRNLLINENDERSLWMIFCPKGNHVKSLFIDDMVFDELAWEIPIGESTKDIMRFVYNHEERSIYFFDIPAAIKKDNLRLAYIYAALEKIRDGKPYDDRYDSRMKTFERNNVCAVTNTLPDLNMLMLDRWRILKLEEDGSWFVEGADFYLDPLRCCGLLIEDFDQISSGDEDLETMMLKAMAHPDTVGSYQFMSELQGKLKKSKKSNPIKKK